jgi:hypothetical protein
MDIISDLLTTVRLDAATFALLDLVSPWGVDMSPERALTSYFVVSGEAWLRLESGPPRRLVQGEFALVGEGRRPALVSHPSAEASPLRDRLSGDARKAWQRTDRTSRLVRLQSQDGDGDSQVLLGRLNVGPLHRDNLRKSAPDLVSFPANGVQLNPWIEVLMRSFDDPADDTIGSGAITHRLGELLLISSLRTLAVQQPMPAYGWMGAITDPKIGSVLR